MSADLMRRAAKVLWDRTASAEPGPWVTEPGVNQGIVWVNTSSYHHAWDMHGFPEEAGYVVLMHPPVGWAIARWLEAAADVIDANEEESSLLDEIGNDFTRQAAEATARAILRERP